MRPPYNIALYSLIFLIFLMLFLYAGISINENYENFRIDSFIDTLERGITLCTGALVGLLAKK